jgi:hypothetical protein
MCFDVAGDGTVRRLSAVGEIPAYESAPAIANDLPVTK